MEVLAGATGQENEIKDIQILNESQLSLFAEDSIICIKNHKESTKYYDS